LVPSLLVIVLMVRVSFLRLCDSDRSLRSLFVQAERRGGQSPAYKTSHGWLL